MLAPHAVFLCSAMGFLLWWFSFMDKGVLRATVHQVKRVRPYWAAEHTLTLFSYAERLEVEPELRYVSNPGQQGTEAGLRERETKLCNWMTNNHTKLPIPSGNVCPALLCTAQALSLQVSDECHTVFLPSRSKCMSDWASECGGPQVKEVRVLPATNFSEEDANNCEEKVDLELRTFGMGSSRGMWESVMGSGWQGGLLDGCGTGMCGILVSRPGIEPGPSAVKVRSPNHWTAREFPGFDVGALQAWGLAWWPWRSLKRCFPDSETLSTNHEHWE